MNSKHSPYETVSVAGSFFSHGFGLFETMKPLEGGIVFFDEHWRRLTRSAGELGLSIPENQASAGQRLKACLEEQTPAPRSALKLCLIKDADDCRFVANLRPPLSAVVATRTPGSITLSDVRKNETSPLCRHKTMNYMENMLILQQAKADGFQDALMLNSKGYIAETTIANIFWIREDKLYTPSLDCGVLPGIIRQTVLESAASLGIAHEEGHYSSHDLVNADAVFLTNAIQGIRPVLFDPDRSRPATKKTATHPLLTRLQKELHRKELVHIYH